MLFSLFWRVPPLQDLVSNLTIRLRGSSVLQQSLPKCPSSLTVHLVKYYWTDLLPWISQEFFRRARLIALRKLEDRDQPIAPGEIIWCICVRSVS